MAGWMDDRQTDRQRQTDRPTDRPTDRQTGADIIIIDIIDKNGNAMDLRTNRYRR